MLFRHVPDCFHIGREFRIPQILRVLMHGIIDGPSAHFNVQVNIERDLVHRDIPAQKPVRPGIKFHQFIALDIIIEQRHFQFIR